MISLFEKEGHKNVMFNDLADGLMIQSNQHIILHNGEAIMLDPGGSKVYSRLFMEMSDVVSPSNLKYIFFSHQDPDIVSSTNTWLTISKADAFISELWVRFMHHFVIEDFVVERIKPIPDKGTTIELNDLKLQVIPAHFMHSAGNFQVYDPESKILYTGDLGASFGNDYAIVEDFSKHIQYMEGFHKRYISCNKAIKLWVEMVRQLEIEMIAPQHGAIFNTPQLAKDFIDWIEWLPCGVDVMADVYKI